MSISKESPQYEKDRYSSKVSPLNGERASDPARFSKQQSAQLPVGKRFGNDRQLLECDPQLDLWGGQLLHPV
jgi:hypothetical protein